MSLQTEINPIGIRTRVTGRIVALRGPLLFASLPRAARGEICTVSRQGLPPLQAQVVSFEESITALAPFDEPDGVKPGAVVESVGELPSIRIAKDPRGMVLDALGSPLNGANPPETISLPIYRSPPPALKRMAIEERFQTGIRSIDSLCTLGKGQRVGLFAPPGIGKSTLLGMISKWSNADAVVIGLIGERGREVGEFITQSLGPDGLKKSTIVVSTSDENPVRRMTAAYTATTIAEEFRERGMNVLLLIDSLTRTARAMRDLSLTAGELPVRQGFPPSVFTKLPQLLERAGNSSIGTLTAIYTVLTHGEEEHDVIAEEIKSILDGHIVLSQKVQNQGIRPSIDIPNSVSRLLHILHGSKNLDAINKVRNTLSLLASSKELLLIGGTPTEELKVALSAEPKLKRFLNQERHDRGSPEADATTLAKIAETISAD